MKKKLIAAGAASLAVAAMPIVGVFADDDRSITDTLSITVNATCTFDAEHGGSATDTTYSATVLNGAQAAFNASGVHTFDVFCNDNEGWTVTATAPVPLAASGVATSHNITYAAAALPSTGAEGTWNAIVSGTGVAGGNTGITAGTGGDSNLYIATDGGVIATEDHSTDGSTFTVTYGAYVGTQTPAGTYTATSTTGGGTMDYTLAAI